MKKLIFHSSLVLLFTLSACQDLLDKEPLNKISVEATFQDFESAKAALTGAYRSLFEINYFNGTRMLYPDLTGGNIKYSQLTNVRLTDAYNFVANSDDSGMNSTYTYLYAILNNLNNIITKVPNLPNGTPATRNRLIAEATVLRAMVHFDLLLMFAQPYNFTSDASHPGIVLNLEPVLIEGAARERATVAASYDTIIADLNQALTLFDASTVVYTGNAKNYTNKWSAKALLARVYLNKGDWRNAYTYADELIRSGNFKLYTQNEYVSAWTQKNTSEAIFEVSVPNGFSGTSLGSYFDITTANATPTSLQMAATDDLLKLYSDTDVRGQATFYQPYTVSGTRYQFCRKYGTSSTLATGVKVLRISEMYLIRAESASELGNTAQALSDLNTIVQRADSSAPTITDTATLIERILTERRKELCFEGFLLMDLSRRGKGVNRVDCISNTCSLSYPSPRFILPLPASTVLVNPKITQNPGY